MRLKQFLICAALIGALALPAAFCEEEPPAAPIPATEAPATEAPATEVPSTEAPTTEAPATEAPATEAPTTEAPATEIPSTEAPSTENPSTEAPSTEAPATAEPSPAPAPTDSAEPSPDPTETPSLAPTETPEATPRPTPDRADDRVQISAEGDARMENGVWRVRLSAPDGKLAFTWTVDGEAGGCLIYVQDGQGNLNFLAETASARMELNGQDYLRGQYTLYVGAQLADGGYAWGNITFEAQAEQTGFPGGMGGFHGGGFGGGSMQPQEEQGFRITPGVALTSKHASGSMNASAYTSSEIPESESGLSALKLSSTQTEITLDGGASSFSVRLEQGKLILQPEAQGECWQLSLLAMNTLAQSGVDRVAFYLGADCRSMPCGLELKGEIYASLRAQGYVSKDAILKIDARGVRVCIADGEYSINESGELLPLEG